MFNELLNTECITTSSLDEFHHYDGIKINYSQQPISDEIFISADNLLFENGIRDQALDFALHTSHLVCRHQGPVANF